jgi:hypothetical protein
METDDIKATKRVYGDYFKLRLNLTVFLYQYKLHAIGLLIGYIAIRQVL